MNNFWTVFAIAAGALLVSVAGLGIGLILGRKAPVKKCSCEFDEDEARRGASGGCCRSGGESKGTCGCRDEKPPAETAAAAAVPASTGGCCSGGACGCR